MVASCAHTLRECAKTMFQIISMRKYGTFIQNDMNSSKHQRRDVEYQSGGHQEKLGWQKNCRLDIELLQRRTIVSMIGMVLTKQIPKWYGTP